MKEFLFFEERKDAESNEHITLSSLILPSPELHGEKNLSGSKRWGFSPCSLQMACFLAVFTFS